MSCLKIIMLALLFWLPSTSCGQLIFNKTFRDSVYSNHVFLSPDNKVYLSGFKNNAMLVKSDSLGNKLWAMEYYRPFDNTLIRDMIDNDAMILVAGTTDDTIKPTPSQNSTNLFLMNVDTANGNIVNSVILGDSLYDYIGAIKKTSDGNFISVGIVNNGPLTYSPCDGFIMKFDKNLNTLWSKRYVSGYVTAFRDIVESDSGHFYISGSINYAQWDSNQALLVKIDSTGNLIWAKSYRDGANDLPGVSIHINGNNLLISGINTDWNQATFFADFAMNLSVNGNIQWFNRYTCSVPLLSGFTYKKHNNLFISGYSTHICGRDSLGNVLFGRRIKKNGVVLNISFSGDDGFYTGGTGALQLIKTDSTYSFCNGENTIFLKTPIITIVDSIAALTESNYEPPYKGTIYQRSVYTHDSLFCMTTADVSNVSPGKAKISKLWIFPNPCIDRINCLLSGSDEANEIRILELHSLTGKLIMSIPIKTNKLTAIEFDQKICPGIYMAAVKDEPGTSVKLVILK